MARRGRRPAPADAVGLREWTVVLDEPALAALRERLAGAGPGDDGLAADPSGNRVRFVAASRQRAGA